MVCAKVPPASSRVPAAPTPSTSLRAASKTKGLGSSALVAPGRACASPISHHKPMPGQGLTALTTTQQCYTASSLGPTPPSVSAIAIAAGSTGSPDSTPWLYWTTGLAVFTLYCQLPERAGAAMTGDVVSTRFQHLPAPWPCGLALRVMGRLLLLFCGLRMDDGCHMPWGKEGKGTGGGLSSGGGVARGSWRCAAQAQQIIPWAWSAKPSACTYWPTE
jgi:hypothetical protein